MEDEFARYPLLLSVRREGVNARKVSHFGVFLPADGAALSVDRNAGEVSYVLICPCELVEQRRLSAVLIARKRESQCLVRRQRVLCCAVMKASTLTKSGVFRQRSLCEFIRIVLRFCLFIRQKGYGDIGGIGLSQRE